jgi:hypothetical protein
MMAPIARGAGRRFVAPGLVRPPLNRVHYAERTCARPFFLSTPITPGVISNDVWTKATRGGGALEIVVLQKVRDLFFLVAGGRHSNAAGGRDHRCGAGPLNSGIRSP